MLDKWEIASAFLGLLIGLARTPHKVVREILGDSDEARYIEAGFYLIPTGLTTQGISQFFGLNPLWGLLMWAFGVILTFYGFAIIAQKHNL